MWKISERIIVQLLFDSSSLKQGGFNIVCCSLLIETHREFNFSGLLWSHCTLEFYRFLFKMICACVSCKTIYYAPRVDMYNSAVSSRWLTVVCIWRESLYIDVSMNHGEGKAWLKSHIKLWRKLWAFSATEENASTADRDGFIYVCF